MPIYEYECRKCGHAFEALQKVNDGALKKCPDCGALQLKKLVSAPQFRLKGTGWYETDFKHDKKKRLADSGDGKPAAESAPADKPESKDGAVKADKGEKTDKADKKETKEKKEAKENKEKKPPASPVAAD
jgi:putative FmdB family regulatory protein